ncbi:DUF222 domain-containing protein [Blastococcus sp. SYSU D00813]
MADTVPDADDTGRCVVHRRRPRPQMRFRWSVRCAVDKIERMCDMAGSGDGGTSSPAEAALRDLVEGSTARFDVRRPRGRWIAEALHGHGGGGLLAEARRAKRARERTRPGAESPVEAAPEMHEAPADGPSTPADARARLLDEGAGWLDAAAEFERGLAQLAGARARALAAFARCRPVSWDRQPGERGAASAASRAARPAALTPVSEWAADEVAVRLRMAGSTASGLLAESVELVEQLPGTLAALETKDMSWAQARALVELLRPVAVGEKAAAEARVLPRAAGQTVAQLRECTRRAIARIDTEAALRRLTAAIQGRKVTRQAGQDGMAVLTAWLPAPVARPVRRGFALTPRRARSMPRGGRIRAAWTSGWPTTWPI